VNPIRIQLHAQAADLAGTGEIGCEVAPGATCADVKTALAQSCPSLTRLLDVCALATDEAYLADANEIGENTRFHLIPPVSGG
jgi:molybdopterin converting factor small subunit